MPISWVDNGATNASYCGHVAERPRVRRQKKLPIKAEDKRSQFGYETYGPKATVSCSSIVVILEYCKSNSSAVEYPLGLKLIGLDIEGLSFTTDQTDHHLEFFRALLYPKATPPQLANPSRRSPSTSPAFVVSSTHGQPVSNPVTTYSPPIGGGVPVTNPVTPPATTNAPVTLGKSWFVVKTGAQQRALQAALDYAYGIGKADCSAIQQGASCYNPDTL
ncbi:X8 domain-containing protein [Forsythia ovata]|uniref:X8 domain-containing protein n=1 Tax=Forsythia ovata TaxID=205694 RepID=A0ABD1RZP5_9LAMI